MTRRGRWIAAGVITVGTLAGGALGYLDGETEPAHVDTATINQNARACASHMGNTAIFMSQLPEDCKEYSFGFGRKIETIEYPNLNKPDKVKSQYILPVASKFLHGEIMTPQEALRNETHLNNRNDVLQVIDVGLGVVLGAFVSFAGVAIEESARDIIAMLQDKQPETPPVPLA